MFISCVQKCTNLAMDHGVELIMADDNMQILPCYNFDVYQNPLSNFMLKTKVASASHQGAV